MKIVKKSLSLFLIGLSFVLAISSTSFGSWECGQGSYYIPPIQTFTDRDWLVNYKGTKYIVRLNPSYPHNSFELYTTDYQYLNTLAIEDMELDGCSYSGSTWGNNRTSYLTFMITGTNYKILLKEYKSQDTGYIGWESRFFDLDIGMYKYWVAKENNN